MASTVWLQDSVEAVLVRVAKCQVIMPFLPPSHYVFQDLLESQSPLFAQLSTNVPVFTSSPSIWIHFKAFPGAFLDSFKRSLHWSLSLQSQWPSVCSLCCSQSPVQQKAALVGQCTASNPTVSPNTVGLSPSSMLSKTPLASLNHLYLNSSLWYADTSEAGQDGGVDSGYTQIACI